MYRSSELARTSGPSLDSAIASDWSPVVSEEGRWLTTELLEDWEHWKYCFHLLEVTFTRIQFISSEWNINFPAIARQIGFLNIWFHTAIAFQIAVGWNFSYDGNRTNPNRIHISMKSTFQGIFQTVQRTEPRNHSNIPLNFWVDPDRHRKKMQDSVSSLINVKLI